jgi:hypothetical protein
MLEMREIKRIVIHCSDSLFGDAALIGEWHKARGWSGIGYHYVILNGYPNQEFIRLKRPQFWRDGELQAGRPIEQSGAHVRGANHDSIGICLVGKEQFTGEQFATLLKLLSELRVKFPGITVVGHYEAIASGDPPKSCPNIDMEWLRSIVNG